MTNDDPAPDLPPVALTRKSGSEPFHTDGQPLGFDLADYWRWAASDLVDNAARGILAEYLVARAVGSTEPVRDAWRPFDVLTPEGVRVQVKSAGYIQAWYQKNFSKISFSIRPTRAFDPATATMAIEPTRDCDVYVFALHEHRDQATLDPRDTAQWKFHVLPRCEVDAYRRSTHSIQLRSLEALQPATVRYDGLRAAVAAAAARQKARA